MTADTKLDGLHTALRRAFQNSGQESAEPDTAWIRTFELVERTAEALRAAEDRIRDLEARYDELVRVTTDEVNAARAKVEAAEARARAAEAVADDIEDRGKVNRDWLVRVRDGLERLPGGFG